MEIENYTRHFVNKEEVSGFLVCSICSEIFVGPVRLKKCGHTFCYYCLIKWGQKHNNCPLCREKFTEDDIKRDLIAYNIINDFDVFCKNEGCPWKGKLMNVPDHLKDCCFDPNRLGDEMKSILLNNKKKENDEDNNINSFTSFNTKVSLKARLYERDKKLISNILSKHEINRNSKNDENSETTNRSNIHSDFNLLDIIKENNLEVK